MGSASLIIQAQTTPPWLPLKVTNAMGGVGRLKNTCSNHNENSKKNVCEVKMLGESFTEILKDSLSVLIHKRRQPTTGGDQDVVKRLFSSTIIPSTTSSAPSLKLSVPGPFDWGVTQPDQEKEKRQSLVTLIQG